MQLSVKQKHLRSSAVESASHGNISEHRTTRPKALTPSHSLCLLHPLCAPSAVVLSTQSCVVLLRAVRVALDGVRVVLAEGCVLCTERGVLSGAE